MQTWNLANLAWARPKTSFPIFPSRKAIFFTSLIFLLSPKAWTQVLFEGYSKIISSGVHIGFTISRFEFDPKTKQYIGTHFVQTNALGGGSSEGYKTYSDENLRPLKYSYTMASPTESKTIDGRKEKSNWVLEVSSLDTSKTPDGLDPKQKARAKEKNGNRNHRELVKFPEGAFFSSNLAYVMLKSKTGMKEKTSFSYRAIAEEDGQIYPGQAVVQNLRKWNGFDSFSVVNEFKGVKFTSEVSPKGEVLSTRSPVQAIETELVHKPELATKDIQISTGILKQLFGDVPIGVTNSVSEDFAKNPRLPPEISTPTMTKDPLPAGQGLHQKGN